MVRDEAFSKAKRRLERTHEYRRSGTSRCRACKSRRTHPGLHLRQAGVEVLVVDMEGATTSRAAVVHARTLEVLEELHVSRRMVADGVTVPDDPNIVWRRLTTSLPGMWKATASYCAASSSVLACSATPSRLTTAHNPGPASPASNAASAAPSDPVEKWGSPSEPACLWRSGPLLLDMYCFQRRSSGIMIGPSHAERSADNDAAYELATPQTIRRTPV
jgi:hypothetical protein